MKVDSISSYSYAPEIAKKGSAPAMKEASTPQKLQGPSSSNAPGNGSIAPHNGLTSAERAFFAQLFPNSTSQISSHKTYSPNGLKASVEPGQIINRKV